MEFVTQCPICGKTLDGSFEATTTHVNMCMDDKQSLESIGNIFTQELASAALDGKRDFKYCPICYKLTGVSASHIKSCGKLKGINARELIRMCEYEPHVDSKAPGSKSTKTPRSKSTKKNSPFGPGCTKLDVDPKNLSNQPRTKQITEFLFKPKKPSKPRKPVEKKEKEPGKYRRKGTKKVNISYSVTITITQKYLSFKSFHYRVKLISTNLYFNQAPVV